MKTKKFFKTKEALVKETRWCASILGLPAPEIVVTDRAIPNEVEPEERNGIQIFHVNEECLVNDYYHCLSVIVRCLRMAWSEKHYSNEEKETRVIDALVFDIGYTVYVLKMPVYDYHIGLPVLDALMNNIIQEITMYVCICGNGQEEKERWIQDVRVNLTIK